MAGEQAGCGAVHPDNVAPALYGGFVLARSADPPDIVRLPVPAGLACAVLHPAIEVHTGTARALLGDTVPLAAAVRQWANVGALVAGAVFGRPGAAVAGAGGSRGRAEARRPGARASTPSRRRRWPPGALGCSLSGSGPSMFALAATLAEAHRRRARRWPRPGRRRRPAWPPTSGCRRSGTHGARVVTGEAGR